MAPRSEPLGDLRTELVGPAPDRLVGDVHAPLREKLLHVTKAQAKAEIEPDRVSDDDRRKPMAFQREFRHRKPTPKG